MEGMALQCLLMKSQFLIVFRLGRRVSDIHMLFRHRNPLKFEYQLCWVIANPNLQGTFKFGNKPILIQLWKTHFEHHPLYPVKILKF